jgi:hypothetical protein
MVEIASLCIGRSTRSEPNSLRKSAATGKNRELALFLEFIFFEHSPVKIVGDGFVGESGRPLFVLLPPSLDQGDPLFEFRLQRGVKRERDTDILLCL